MTSDELDFSDLPPFPNDVPTAPLLRLSLQKLLDHDEAEINRLYETCCDVGFFYLDIRDAAGHVAPDPSTNGHTDGSANGHTKGHTNGHPNGQSNGDASHAFLPIDGNTFLTDASTLFTVADTFYDLPVSEKVSYDFKDRGSYFGYKGYGAGIIDKSGAKDRNEFYNISKDDVLGLNEPLPAPKILDPHRELFSRYCHSSHAIVTLLLQHLNTSLGLPPQTLLDLHKLYASSGDQIRLVRSPPQPEQDRRAALGAHTDFGSVTLLFNMLGGLQILPPDTDGKSEQEKVEAWQYVRPLKGHCVVNLGDAMVKFSRGVLRSNTHRVVNPPGDQGDSTRTSIVYFNRPTDEVLLKPLEGSEVIDGRRQSGEEDDEVVTSKEWVLRRALGRRGVGSWDKSEGTETARAKGKKDERGMREIDVGGAEDIDVQ